MRAPHPYHRLDPGHREGAVLGMVLVIMVIVSLLGVGLLRLAMAEGVEAGKEIAATRAFWAAEAGIERAKSLGQKRRRPFPQIHAQGGWVFGNSVLNGTVSGGSYSVDVVDSPDWTNSTQRTKRYLIRARGTSAGFTRTVSVRAHIQTYASFMHASNFERDATLGRIYFGSGDVIDGPVYVNDQLNLYGTPVFRQEVNSASNSVNYQFGATIASFQGGLNLNATPLDVNGQFSGGHITDIQTEAQTGGLCLDGPDAGDYEFNFRSDGTFDYTLKSGGPTNTDSLGALNGAIYVEGDAWVDGVVNGQVTLAAQDSIYISNSITYASAASPAPWATNFNPSTVTDQLGLMASNQVQIAGTNAVNIHAAIMVTGDGGGFNASNRFVFIGQPRINLYGSLAQYRRGIVGRVSGEGYLKNYKFDSRFFADAPPNFPYSVYTFSRWRQGGG